MSAGGPTRREVLRAGAALAATLGPARAVFATPRAAMPQQRRVQRVVLVRFGGGVRFAETFGHADPKSVVPNLVRAAQGGVTYTNLRNNGRLDHLGATAQILCGQTWPADQPLGERPTSPTIFEYYRKATQAAAPRCLLLDPSWHAPPLDHSSAEGYGAAFGGTILQTRRLGVAQMRFVQDAVKNPKEQVWRDAEALRVALLDEDFERAEQVDPVALEPTLAPEVQKLRTDAFDREKVPQKVGKTRIRSADGLAVFLAHMAMKSRAVDPAILVLDLHGPDVAHRGSSTDYVEAVRTLDGWLGEFLEILDKEKWLGSSAVVITPDVGRDLSGTGAGPTTHRAGDLGCRRLFAVVLAPGLKGGSVVERTVSQADLCPTMGAWLGVPTPGVEKGRAPLQEVV